MARFLQNRDGGKIDEEGLYRHLDKLFPGEVITGLNATQQDTPGLGVEVQLGAAMIPSGDNYPYVVFMDAAEDVTLATADGSNPRIDLIVGYVDLTVVSSTNPNNPNAFKLENITGTPAGSPTVPNAAAIQAVIGASNPYIILARVAVAAGATTITNSNVTDVRNFAQLTSTNVDFGGAGAGIWREEIGRTTLGSPGDTISVTNLPARKYLKVIIIAYATGGNINSLIRFNNDNGTNYAIRNNLNGGSDSSGVSQTAAGSSTEQGTGMWLEFEVINLATKPKLLEGHITYQNAASAATAIDRQEITAKWNNAADQISRIDFINSAAGSFDTGSEIIVLGHD